MGNDSSAHPLRELGPGLLGELVGLLTHDIRNPLAALSSNVGYLTMVGTELSQDIREAIFDLQLSVEVLARISDAMETVSQELRAVAPPDQVVVDVQQLLSALRAPVERAATSHGVTLRIDAQDEVRVSIGESAFCKALTNLLHNAISLAPPSTEVLLRVLAQPDQVHFRVEDQGTPLDKDLWDAAFSAEGQISVKGRAAGRYTRGLGLYMVGRCAQLAGAVVQVQEGARGSAIDLVAPRVH